MQDYSKEYIRLSLLGVNNINNLTECTRVLPAARKTFTQPDLPIIKQWLDGAYPNLGQYIEDGQTITSTILALLSRLLGGKLLFARE